MRLCNHHQHLYIQPVAIITNLTTSSYSVIRSLIIDSLLQPEKVKEMNRYFKAREAVDKSEKCVLYF